MLGNGVDWELDLENFNSAKDLLTGFTQYLVGSFSLAILTSGIFWILFYLLFLFQESKSNRV